MHKFGASGLQLALAREYFYNSNYGNQKGKNIYVRIGARARTFASGSGPCDHAEPHALLSPSSFVFFLYLARYRVRARASTCPAKFERAMRIYVYIGAAI